MEGEKECIPDENRMKQKQGSKGHIIQFNYTKSSKTGWRISLT